MSRRWNGASVAGVGGGNRYTYPRERPRSVEQPLRPSAMLRPATASSILWLQGNRRLVSLRSRAGKGTGERAAIE
jgi:hypothetical protein